MPRLERELRPVCEREERVGGEHRAGEARGRIARALSSAIFTASTRLCWPAPMPIVCRSFATTIAFEPTCLHTRHANSRSPHCSSVNGAGRDLHRLAVLDVPVAVLDEQAAEHALVVPLAGRVRAPVAVGQDAQRLPVLQRRERVLVEGRRVDHVRELLRDLLGEGSA